jgi:ComF family protein
MLGERLKDGGETEGAGATGGSSSVIQYSPSVILSDSEGSFDLVCPVPLHWTRRFTRGYNQAEVIGREVARVLGVPFEPRLLRRVRRTGTQTKLSPEERAANISGAFAVRKSIASPLQILLVDDVFTTGATAAACAAALREAFGPEVRISVATLAFSE